LNTLAYKYCLITSLALALGACGFQLRGELQFADHLSPVYLQSDKSVDLRNALRTQLRVNNIELSRESETAASKLIIEEVARSRHVLSVDSRGRASEYEVRYRLRYSFSYSGEGEHSKQMIRQIDLSRELLFDPDSVLALGNEIELLYREMEQDAARLVLRQLQAVK